MPDIEKEKVANPNLLVDAKARVEMLQRLDTLGGGSENSHTMSGLYTLGVEMQQRMNTSLTQMWPPEFRQGLSRAGTEFAARVGITIIDRGSISLSYEQGNLHAWLREKGLDVDLDPAKRFDYPVDWSRLPQGYQEGNYYFVDQPMTPQQLGVMAETVAAKFAGLRDKAGETYGPDAEETKLLAMAAAVQLAVSTEIGSVISGQGGLTADQTKELIGPQLKAVGFSLVDSK